MLRVRAQGGMRKAVGRTPWSNELLSRALTGFSFPELPNSLTLEALIPYTATVQSPSNNHNILFYGPTLIPEPNGLKTLHPKPPNRNSLRLNLASS